MGGTKVRRAIAALAVAAATSAGAIGIADAAKPQPGTVGNAVNVPKGQSPDGNDGNNGWRCDGNKGIGQGNPAHAHDCGGGVVTSPPPVDGPIDVLT